MQSRSLRELVSRPRLVPALLCSAVIAACGGGGGGGSPGGGTDPIGGGGSSSPPVTGTTPPRGELDESLRRLGVDTSTTPRVANNGEPLPESYSPLGSTRAVTRIVELFLVGVDDPDTESTAFEVSELQSGALVPLHVADPFEATTVRAGTAADVDGDGLDEGLFVYRDEALSLIRLRLVDDGDEGFASQEWDLAASAGIENLEIVAGDFDGDLRAELVVAASRADGVSLLFVAGGKSEGYTLDTAATVEIPATPSQTGDTVVVMSAGNIDYDAADEFAVAVTEYAGNYASSRNADPSVTRWFVHDDAASGHAELDAGFVEARIDNATVGTFAAGVALGDIDADGVDEIVVAGQVDSYIECESESYLVIAYDDAAHAADDGSLAVLDSTVEATRGEGGCESNGNSRRVLFTHVNTLDIDGDQVDEIQVGRAIFEDFRMGGLVTLATIPRNEFSHAGSNRGFRFSKGSTALAVGDVTGDSLDDIVFRMPRVNEQAVSVWGYTRNADNTLGFGKKLELPTEGAYFANVGTEDPYPLMVPANVDNDSFVVQYAGSVEYDYVFSEPIIIAALAGPPCATGIGQNTDACTTRYGESTSRTLSSEAAVTLSASGHVGVEFGVELPIIQAGVEIEYEETISASVTAAVQGAYTVERSYFYETGALEDTVVVTTVPFDRYTYEVVQHPNPNAVGTAFVLSVPRAPRTFQVERAFYNASVEDAASRIGDDVFAHTLGDPSSYPSAAEKDTLLRRFDGLEFGSRDVGIGTGVTGVEIDVSSEIGASATLAVGWERSVRVTGGGVMSGFSVGAEVSSTLGYSVGEGTSYGGNVGELDQSAPNFSPDNLYSYGMMAYTQEGHASGQEFQVINYWTE